jgi:hypothetical protein
LANLGLSVQNNNTLRLISATINSLGCATFMV